MVSRARSWVAFCLALLLLAAQAAAAQAVVEQAGGPEPRAWTLDPVYEVETLNAGYASRPPEGALRTPKSALSHFVDAIRQGRYAVAAQALNMNGLPRHEQGERGPELARKLGFVLQRTIDLDWSTIPDRPDGADDLPDPLGRGGGDGRPYPRRTLLLGQVDGDLRSAEIRLNRVRAVGQDAVWVFSWGTVERIDALYEAHGPNWAWQLAPEWARVSGASPTIWQVLALLVATLVAALLGAAVQRLMRYGASRLDPSYTRLFLQRTTRPIAALVAVSVLWLLAATVLVLEGALNDTTMTLLQIGTGVAAIWFAVAAVSFLADDIARDHVDRLAHLDEARARQRDTMLSVARRTLTIVVLLVGTGVLLSQFAVFRTLGTSLLASAGVASVVLGIAAQSSLGNLLAGIQIALTRPLRIGDTVQFDDTWSYVEDITYTYVVIRTWDHRRFVVPNLHVISTPQENWDVSSSSVVMSVHLYVDYRTPVEEVRRKYHELVDTSEDWDATTDPSLVVTAWREDVLELRVLCSAPEPARTWRQSVWLREELVAFLQALEDGRYLPRRRLMVEGLGGDEGSHDDAP